MKLNNSLQTAVFTAAQDGDYPLEWLDRLVNVSLNPEKLNHTSMVDDDLETIISRLEEEDSKLQLLIKKQVFSLADDRDIENLIRRYHNSLIILINQTIHNQEKLQKGKKLALKLYTAIIESLDRLVQFVESRFSNFLSPEDLIPPTMAMEKNDGIHSRLKKIKKRLAAAGQPASISKLVFDRVEQFMESSEQGLETTFRSMHYTEELIQGLENIVYEPSPAEGYSTIDKLLIYLNFNSKHYLQKLTKFLSKKVLSASTETTRLEKLHFYFKGFKQLQRKPDLIFNPNYPGLEDLIENWFNQEINYYEKKLDLAGTIDKPSSVNSAPISEQQSEKEKLLCNLSADQIALILRAADEARIVQSKSLTEVFRNVVPFLSTPFKKDLSFNSVRSKSYNAEEPDKQGAIHALRRMIEKIEGY